MFSPLEPAPTLHTPSLRGTVRALRGVRMVPGAGRLFPEAQGPFWGWVCHVCSLGVSVATVYHVGFRESWIAVSKTREVVPEGERHGDIDR